MVGEIFQADQVYWPADAFDRPGYLGVGLKDSDKGISGESRCREGVNGPRRCGDPKRS